jgi:hypothetical protein
MDNVQNCDSYVTLDTELSPVLCQLLSERLLISHVFDCRFVITKQILYAMFN